MRVHVVDPSAYTPPYDHALCSALAAAGAEVALYTSRFAYGSVAVAEGYERREAFYRLAARIPNSRARRAAKLAEHIPDMLRYRRAAREADVVHFQWLSLQWLDGRLLPSPHGPNGSRRPLVLSAHDILPREAHRGQREAQRRLYAHFDAVVVHSEHGRERLTGELGLDPARVHVIPHGAFAHLAEPRVDEDDHGSTAAQRTPTAGEHGPTVAEGNPTAALPFQTDKPVVLCFGLMRPYKGIDVLLEAWRGIEDAELWIVGMPRMDISGLLAAAPPGVRFVPRFIGEDELAAYFRRANLLVLPYREIDQSGVLFAALAFGKPLLLSDVGGFPEIAATGAARTVPAGDAAALHRELLELLGDSGARERMSERALTLARDEHSWSSVADRTLALYRQLLET